MDGVAAGRSIPVRLSPQRLKTNKYPMKTLLFSPRAVAFWPLAGLAAALISGSAYAQEANALAKFHRGDIFSSTNSVSDIQGVAHDTDPLVVNPWGLTPGPEGNLHVNLNGTGVNGHYAPNGALITGSAVPHTFTIPQATITSGTIGSPTGIVLDKLAYTESGSNDFIITGTGSSKPSHYLIATEDGAICGYNENVEAGAAIKAYDGSPLAGYTGVALSFVTGSSGALEHRLYAANFRAGKVDVFTPSFTPVALTGSDTFTDPNLPTPPVGYSWSPFNVHHVAFLGRSAAHEKLSVQRRILVAYALHSGTGNPMNDVPTVSGSNFGAVAVFTPEGEYLRDLVPASAGMLNSPWGLAISHTPVISDGASTFVLVGSHGNGQINAYAFDAGAHEGAHITTLENDQKLPLAFDGLWALHFGPKKERLAEFLADVDELREDGSNLYFSAGLLDETHGLVGKITVPHLH